MESTVELERLRDFVENLDHAIFYSQKVSTQEITYVSPRAATITGFPIETWKGKPLFLYSRIPDEDKPKLEHASQLALKGIPQTVEHRFLARDGAILWMRSALWISKAPVSSEPELCVVCIEITSLKKSEDTLRKSLSLFQTLADTTPAMIWLSGLDRTPFFFNKAWCTFRGRTLEQELANGWLEGIHPEDLDKIFQTRLDAFNEQTPFEIEFRLKRFDGVYRWVHGMGAPRFNESGQFLGFVGTTFDITERKTLEEDLRFLVEVSPIFLSSSLDKTAAFETIAKAAVPRLADWCAVDIVHNNHLPHRIAFEHMNPELNDTLFDYWQKFPPTDEHSDPCLNVIRTQKSLLFKDLNDNAIHQIAKDPVRCDALNRAGLKSLMIVPLKVRGLLLGAVTFGNTENSANFEDRDLFLAEALCERASLAAHNAQLYTDEQRLNKAKDDFLAVLSHELRTPMNVILGWLELLRTRDFQAADMKQILATIERNARLQMNLINDILDMSRIVTGKLTFEETSVDFASVLANTVDSFRQQLEAKDLKLQTHIDTQKAAFVLGDASRLAQVVSNLMSNAIKFTPPHGSIFVDLDVTNGLLRLIVTDTGQGIDADFLPKVFDRFRQENSSLNRQQGGLGIGLGIVRHIVEAHHGHVSVFSEGKGQGSSFTVELPLAQPMTQVSA